jgi:hypothetical protein
MLFFVVSWYFRRCPSGFYDPWQAGVLDHGFIQLCIGCDWARSIAIETEHLQRLKRFFI